MKNSKEVEECKKAITTNMKAIVDFLPLIIPRDEEDKKVMELGTDMIRCLISDLESPNTNIDDILDVPAIERDWHTVSQKLVDSNGCREVYDAIYSMIDECEDNDEE